MTHNHVLFKTLEAVALTSDCRFVKDFGRLLERCRRNPRLRLKRCPRDTLKYQLGRSLACVTCLHQCLIGTLQQRVLVAELA